MKVNKVKYIGFYDNPQYHSESRNYSLAATYKMDYIASSLVKAGYKIQFISPSWTANCKGWYKKRTSDIADGITLTVGSTFGANNRIMRKFRVGWSWLWLFCYLVCNVKRGEKVLAYHSLMLDFPVYCAKLIKRFKLILETEEEYCKIFIKQPRFFEWLEKKIISYADYYLLCSDLMAEGYANMNKKSVIIYGSYEIHNAGSEIAKSAVWIVYSGTNDSLKAGAFNAVKVAKYLDERFSIHMTGFGSAVDIQRLKSEIEESNKTNVCQVKYDGIKEAKEYIDYLAQCDIGLSTQVASGEYLKFSFPSKILTYMGVGLRVVTSRIDCVQRSKIGDLMVYYDNDEPMAIAEAIKAIDLTKPYDGRARLKELDKQFVEDIRKLLEAN